MDGFKRHLNESIQLKLSVTLSLAILIAAAVAAAFSFVSAFDEAHELQDDVLHQIAMLMDKQRLSSRPLGGHDLVKENDEESHVIVQRLNSDDPSSAAIEIGRKLPLPAGPVVGFYTLRSGREPLRVLVKTMATGEQIAVVQEAAFRDEIARDSALRTVMPLLILVPVLLLIVADLVRKMFRPIAAPSSEIELRAERELHPMDESHLPVEVRPFVSAINELLTRVAKPMEMQRGFVADAAHELRSPLTALSLQAERLADAGMSAPARERLDALRPGYRAWPKPARAVADPCQSAIAHRASEVIGICSGRFSSSSGGSHAVCNG